MLIVKSFIPKIVSKSVHFLNKLSYRLADKKYQHPLPWLGDQEIREDNKGTYDRLDEIFKYIDSQNLSLPALPVLLDVGCSRGFFSLSFMEKGFVAYGVEGYQESINMAFFASQSMSKKEGATFIPISLEVTEKNVHTLPASDITLCLAVWHHFVKYEGFNEATSILSTLWDKTKSVMFFDSGESEVEHKYNIPFNGTNPKDWFLNYLQEVCKGSQVHLLGGFSAFGPKSESHLNGAIERKEVKRNLFVIIRK